MSSPQDHARVSVRILEKEYFVACPYEERAALLDAAEFLNGRMREIRDSGKVVGLDRIAVMVALNLANELLAIRAREQQIGSSVVGRVRKMRERLDATVEHSRQLEL